MSTNTLIAFVDGSVYSESVCNYAAWIAKSNGWTVKVYHVMGRNEASANQDLSGAIRLGARSRLLGQLSDLDAQRAKVAKEVGRAILEDAKAIIQSSADVEVETRLRQDDIVATLTAKENSAEMVVIGKRGETVGETKEQLGSNLERILRTSSNPVLIANRAFTPIDAVTIAFDGSSSSQDIVNHVAQLKLFAGMPVELVYSGRRARQLDQQLKFAQDTLNTHNHRSSTIFVPGDPDEEISNLTSESTNKILIMGAYSHSKARSLLLGSTTTALIQSCRCPILIFR